MKILFLFATLIAITFGAVCNIGQMKCLSQNTYTTCANYTGTPAFGPTQQCQPGLVCSPSGDFIYCVPPQTPPNPPPAACQIGQMKCLSQNTYTTCAAYTGVPAFGPTQQCQPGLVCTPVGSNIYCTQPQPSCSPLIGPFTMDQGSLIQPLPHVDTQFTPSPTYRCTLNGDCDYHSFGPGNEVTTQDPVVEGDSNNNFVIDFRDTNCRPSTLSFGLSFAEFNSPNTLPILRVRDDNGSIVSETTFPVVQGHVFFGARVNYSGPAGATFEVVEPSSYRNSRFAFDNLSFCCAECTPGHMRCASTNTYQTCSSNAAGIPGFYYTQQCQPGLVCQPSGDFIYCV